MSDVDFGNGLTGPNTFKTP